MNDLGLCGRVCIYTLLPSPQNKLQLELAASDQTAHEKGHDSRCAHKAPISL